MGTESFQSFPSLVAWFNHLQQCVLDCEAYSMLSTVPDDISLPEGVVFFSQRSRVCQACFMQSSYVYLQSQELVVDDGCLSRVPNLLEVFKSCGHCEDFPTSQCKSWPLAVVGADVVVCLLAT